MDKITLISTSPYFTTGFVILIYMIVWYLLAQWKRDNSIIDIAWGLGFVCICFVVEFLLSAKPNLILFGLVTIWGLRLALYIFIRGIDKGEDWRYKKWREDWGKRWWFVAFFQVFMLQGFLMFLIALPLIHINSEAEPFYSYQILGLVLWFFGFLWEAIADLQMYRFKSDPQNKGKIMTKGLWKYSRHPNYFGEIVLWWGIFIFALPYNVWYISLISPIVMSWLLMRVSGVPMLESKYKKNTAYQEYIKNTNALIPKLF